MKQNLVYSKEPENNEQYTKTLDKAYTLFAGMYDVIVKVLPVWKNWIKQVIPYIQGPRVLEVSFGTGYLLTQYADKFDTYGIDYNEKLLSIARKNLERKSIRAKLEQGDIVSLPYEDEAFDCIVNTMAFTGYPDGIKAMSELHRVLKKGGRLLILDINYPADRNWLGMKITRLWASLGDIIRDMDAIFSRFNFEYTDKEVGGFGSVHLYIAEKR
jgi:ubiquinone/menaquinone biosynthesis C-methylase UbiE